MCNEGWDCIAQQPYNTPREPDIRGLISVALELVSGMQAYDWSLLISRMTELRLLDLGPGDNRERTCLLELPVLTGYT